MATSSGADWLDKLIARHSAELDDLEEAEVEQFLVAYEDGRRHLKERLDALEGSDRGESWTAHSHRAAMLQVEVGIRQLQDRLSRVLGEQEERRHAMAVDHLKDVLRRAEPEFGTSWPNIATAATRRLQAERELLLYKHSIDRYGADLTDKIRRELVRGRITQAPIRETTKRIAGADRSVFDGLKGRAELIARMENNRAYGAGHQAGLEVSADVIDGPVDPSSGERPRAHGDPLMKKATEFRDRRNHPMSLALDGRVAPVAGEWEVPVADVVEAGARLKKPTGGIVWPLEGGTYKGAAYPAHFNDRGRQVPWRASWAGTRERVKARGEQDRAETAEWRAEAKRKADERRAEKKLRGAGRSHKPGDRADAFRGGRRPPAGIGESLAAVPRRFKNDPRWGELIKDPDHEGAVTEGSIREAMAVLEAERRGLFPSGASRGPRGLDFYDGEGRPWDVKAPPSKSDLNPQRQAEALLKRIRQQAHGQNVRVLLDTTYLSPKDYGAIWQALEGGATLNELDRIVLVNVHLGKRP